MPRLRVKNNAIDNRRLRIGKKKQSSSTRSSATTSEKFIVCEDREGDRFYAMKTDDDFTRLCVPKSDGVLIVTDQTVCATDFKEAHDMNATPVFERGTLKYFDTRTEFEKAATSVQDDMKRIVDFRDIKLDGLASTFSTLTPADRDGDVIGDNAFDKTIRQFLKNPVMLTDHENSVNNIAGSFKKLRSSQRGLEVEAEVSNAPELRKIRFLIAEGHLKAFSIGGLFKFSDNNPRMVEEIELFEISLVAVPANPDALFEARSVSIEDAKTAFKRMKLHYK